MEPTLPSSMPLVASLSGAGRGKPLKQPESALQMKEENRHIRAKQEQQRQQPPPLPQMSKEEAVKKAREILSRRSEGDIREDMGLSGGRGRGRGRQSDRGRGRGRGRGGYSRKLEEDAKELEDDLYLGDDANGEKLAQTIGAENMAKLVEGFEELSSRVMPSPLDDAYMEAMHTNFMIEFEPEYLMADFETNPDIDEKPPVSLRDALKKVKPFLMSYEGIQNQEEWEEAIKETMENVPLLQEIIDHYSGPDRVTAKKQQEELERVAKTLPKSAPASVKNFANRVVLSLQSNPGWGFDKKCQFMDKLVWEVSQQYK
ncbi:receptor-like protein 12-like [Hibiscus syriacus]|uniref:Receptor-like protein 12-like n=1 Tax=Hibiscus syriacus TaxID=106335 RepID=A0A6A2XK61_HIBSY|nr:la-related protein 1B [Hibiscus syriacus]KAE8676641.1 receptor-like protein 12-like [Hibiscus syriacus]